MLQLDQVSKFYGPQKVLKQVSLRLGHSQSLALLGASGCGKSTLLKIIAGLVVPSEGKIVYLNQDITRVKAHLRKIPLVFQDHLLFPHLSVADNIAFGLRVTNLSSKEIKQRVGESLDLIQLSGLGQRFPSQISGGQRQRVALARAMVLRPQLILLDEPLSNLDTSLRMEMRRLITHYCQQFGTAMILVTHDPQEALSLGDFLAVMNHGEISEFSRGEELYRNPKTLVGAKMMGFENKLPPTESDVLVLRPEDLQVHPYDGGTTQNGLVGTLKILEFEGDLGRAAFDTTLGPLAWRGMTQGLVYQSLLASYRSGSGDKWLLSWDPDKVHRIPQHPV